MELQLWFEIQAIMFTTCPRTLCTGAPLFLVVLQTDKKKKKTLSLTVCVLHFSRGVLNTLPVYVLNIKHVEPQTRGRAL